jgi:hypothetical protein
MVCNDHYEDENPQKIGKEAEVLVVKHLWRAQKIQTSFFDSSLYRLYEADRKRRRTEE